MLTHIYAGDIEISSTPSHRYWVIGKGWTYARDIVIGDELQYYNGNTVIVSDVQEEYFIEPLKVYNLEVADWHTYFVSKNAIWVHNEGCAVPDIQMAANATVEMELEGSEASLDTIVTDINGLQNISNFKSGALEHIFEGEINASGKAVGFHYEGFPSTKGSIIAGTETTPNSFGVYKAQIEVNGIAKTSNSGFSTFFPKNWSAQTIVNEINTAYTNKIFINGNTYLGTASNGMDITMFINSNGKIMSAFPTY